VCLQATANGYRVRKIQLGGYEAPLRLIVGQIHRPTFGGDRIQATPLTGCRAEVCPHLPLKMPFGQKISSEAVGAQIFIGIR